MPDTNTPTSSEAPVIEKTALETLADQLVIIAVKQLKTGIDYRQPKLDAIMKAEELYYNKVTKTLRGRFNIPLPIVSGFVDALLAKIDDEININYDKTEDADTIKARKVTAAWAFDSAPTRGMWAIKDLLVKKLAIFSGRGIFSIFSESDPQYRNCLDIVDAFDFIAEPNGGWHLENHLFCGRENIFRTMADLKAGSQYNQGQVEKLNARMGTDEYKNNYSLYQNHQRRLNNVGLDPATNNYVGEPIVGLVEWNMTHDGQRYYMLFEPSSAVWVRIAKLEEITGEPRPGELPAYQYKSWATHYDYWNFWSKAPVDDVVPVAIGMKILTNFMFDDFQKKLFGQRIYDADMIGDPAQLEWDRPDKLIAATLPAGKKLSDAVYEFQTGDNSTITINLLDYMRNFVALESGVTPGAKGNEDSKTLGVAKINEGQVADRLGLTNKFYSQCHSELGLAYLRGFKMCMTSKMLVRMIGENGTESAEITKEDVNFSSEPDIRITGGRTELLRNEQKKTTKINGLITALKFAPDTLNKKVTTESLLESSEWSADEIAALMDVTADGSEIESVKASEAIQAILDGKTPPLYKGATTRFQNKIYLFATEREKDPAMQIKLSQYALAHRQIVIENMARKAMMANMAAGQMIPTGQPGQPAQTGNSAAAAPGAGSDIQALDNPAANQ